MGPPWAARIEGRLVYRASIHIDRGCRGGPQCRIRGGCLLRCRSRRHQWGTGAGRAAERGGAVERVAPVSARTGTAAGATAAARRRKEFNGSWALRTPRGSCRGKTGAHGARVVRAPVDRRVVLAKA